VGGSEWGDQAALSAVDLSCECRSGAMKTLLIGACPDYREALLGGDNPCRFRQV
jgi:hypothetical protein